MSPRRVNPIRRASPALSPEASHLASVGFHGSNHHKVPRPDDIVYAVARALGIDHGDMLARNRTRAVVRARQCAMLLLRRWLCCSYPEVKAHLNYKSHCGCMEGIRAALLSARIGRLDPGAPDGWCFRAIESAAQHLFGDYAPDPINLAIFPIPPISAMPPTPPMPSIPPMLSIPPMPSTQEHT